MRTLRQLRPAAVCIYFIAVIGGTVFVNSPLLRAVSLCFAAAAAVCCGVIRPRLSEAGFYLITAAAMTLLNPVIVTYGGTVLFRIGSRPYTLEALMYGGCNAMALVAVMLWFRLLTAALTSDRISAMLRLPLLSSAASVFTLTLRYVPEIKRRYADIRMAQKVSGYSGGEAYVMRVKSAVGGFFSLIASSLELSAKSADSMKARGYTLSPHTFIDERPLKAGDVMLASAAVLSAAVEVWCGGSGRLYTVFYPGFVQKCPAYCAAVFACLCALPMIFAAKEELRWRSSGQRG